MPHRSCHQHTIHGEARQACKVDRRVVQRLGDNVRDKGEHTRRHCLRGERSGLEQVVVLAEEVGERGEDVGVGGEVIAVISATTEIVVVGGWRRVVVAGDLEGGTVGVGGAVE